VGAALSQERLWLTEPRRATCLATVAQAEGDWFAPDRCLFAPRSRSCRHPQNPDEGHIVVAGEKRVVAGVQERDGLVWLRLRGTVPRPGDRLQCQLDQDVRLLASRAHTAMHAMLASLSRSGAPPHVTDPEVKGGGSFRLTLRAPMRPDEVKAALDGANALLRPDMAVEREFASGAAILRLALRQDFHPPHPHPGPDPVQLVRFGAVAYPCDGTHVERTGKVGRLVVAHARSGSAGFVLVGKVVDAR
jgi:Ser-tRNA(Ala) deacylase AlaX